MAATLAPRCFPAGFRVHGAVETYFDTAVVITVLVLLGQVLELRARHRTGAAIRQLLGLAPKTARMVRAGREDVSSSRWPARRYACASGPARRSLSTASLSKAPPRWTSRWSPASRSPVDKGPGDRVIGATICGNGTFMLRAERVGSDTLLAQIVRMVGEAQRTRAPIQRLADADRRRTSSRR